MASFTTSPVFSLFRIKPTEIHRKYLSGHFTTAKLPPLTRKITHVKETLKDVTTENFVNPIFSDTMGGKKIIPEVYATTNCKQYEIMYNTGKIPVGGRCWYCHSDFKNESVGIPFHVEKFHDDNGGTIIGFHTDGIFHDFRCALKYLRTQPGYREMRSETETYLFNMFRCMYPDAPPLQEANDFRLLDINGGPLSWDKWNDINYIYIETPRIIMLPFKRTFHQRKVQTG